jgi:hydroxypyruvate isomerase
VFDIYHVQIMAGDVIRRLRRHIGVIGHIHTAGVPGRNEIDDTQEINYPPIMRAIAETGYKGFLTFEYFHPYTHYPEALIWQTSDSLDRILGRKA